MFLFGLRWKAITCAILTVTSCNKMENGNYEDTIVR